MIDPPPWVGVWAGMLTFRLTINGRSHATQLCSPQNANSAPTEKHCNGQAKTPGTVEWRGFERRELVAITLVMPVEAWKNGLASEEPH